MKSRVCVVVALLSVACASEPSSKTDAALDLCNGAEQLRLQFYVEPDDANTAVGSLLVRNGVVYLRVDGACRYWVYGAGLRSGTNERVITALDPVLTGELSTDDANRLVRDLKFSEWKSYDGALATLPDAGLTAAVFTDGEHTFSCGRACDGSGLPAGAANLRRVALDWTERLTDAGTSVSGPVRVVTVDARASTSEWEALGYSCNVLPASLQPSSLAIGTMQPPVGSLVESEADSLRELREHYRQARLQTPIPPEIPPWSRNVALPVCDDNRVWSLLVSDVIEPYEVAGAVPLP